MKNDKITYLIGPSEVKACPVLPYDELVCEFLEDLSKELRRRKEAILYPDIMSMAFWCRKSNILKLKEEFHTKRNHIGRGIVFHIAPSNVPVNFAFSYLFGLLAGNANIVRVPSKKYMQISIICDSIETVLEQQKYQRIKDSTSFISYERDEEITKYYSSICDARIIWGGDETIRELRQFPIKERAVEVVFADRYSIAIINSLTILEMKEDEILKLAEKFYNDTYLMDQNACSTPHLLLWYGGNEEKAEAKQKFWNKVHEISVKYDLSSIKAVDKYTDLCHLLIDREDIKRIERYDNYLYIVEMQTLPQNMYQLRGRYGLFYQCDLSDLNEIAPCIDSKVQTLLYVGMDKNELLSFVLNNHLQGIDRIVPMGNALDIGVFWDGYDIITQLSRLIDIK